jgi:hypothetical protein
MQHRLDDPSALGLLGAAAFLRYFLRWSGPPAAAVIAGLPHWRSHGGSPAHHTAQR